MLIEAEFNRNDEEDKINAIAYIEDEIRSNKSQIINDEHLEIDISIEQEDNNYINVIIEKDYFESDIINDFTADYEDDYDNELEEKLEDEFECFIDKIVDELREKLDI